jgi:ribosomal-protein-alanine N-acetyltransferase
MRYESGLRIQTARLELFAATVDLAKAEVNNISQLAMMLRCDVPTDWPPPLNDEGSQRWFLRMLEADTEAKGWYIWYVVRNELGRPREIVGNAGFKGKPADGVCELGYSLLPQHQKLGYATEAVVSLIAWAFQDERVRRVIAETFPGHLASIHVMEKCGMRFTGDGNPEDGQRTVRYELARHEFGSSKKPD